MSAATSLFGLTEPIFVPEYWNPPTLFDLAPRSCTCMRPPPIIHDDRVIRLIVVLEDAGLHHPDATLARSGTMVLTPVNKNAVLARWRGGC